MTLSMAWVILTLGDRPDQLRQAIASIQRQDLGVEIVVVENGGRAVTDDIEARVVRSAANLGVPGGRDLGARSTTAPIIGFLDDDAIVLAPTTAATVVAAFDRDPALGAVSLRLIDEDGRTARRHVPRPGSSDASQGGAVTTFLGGACAIRRSAYDAAGGYWADLHYAHEELELTWRMVDRGYWVRYLADELVEHPRTAVGRHPRGWWFTGRNRVMIARRDLPLVVGFVHVTVWLGAGLVLAGRQGAARSYVGGWLHGWREPVERHPISWRTIVRLARWGRPPIF